MTPSLAGGLKVAYYGDDFTGATDTLATAARAGLRTVLFLGLPDDAHLRRAGPLDCVGIAGAARAMAPAEMRDELEPVGQFFARLGAPVVHYKTCSTFDSSARVGSIGAAISVLRRYTPNPLVSIVGGQPNLERYCVFGNLFAAAGSGGAVHRIDRHPTMSRHPVTPMHEADLRLHLAEQGLGRISSIDCTAYDAPAEALEEKLDALLAQSPDAVLFDVGHELHLAPVGRAIWTRAQRQSLLAAGPSSVVQALAAHWKESGAGGELPVRGRVGAAAGPVMALSGSLSPITARQVDAATSFIRLRIDPGRLAETGAGVYRSQMAGQARDFLRAGKSVLAFTPAGNPAADTGADCRGLAAACADFLSQVLKEVPVRRIGIAGGDTSSHAMLALDAWGMSYEAALSEGVALCRLHSDDPSLDGLEVMLKGGQMGPGDMFERLLHGSP